jgi:hypothetical protein
MPKETFDFAALGEAIRADTQAFLNSYAKQYPEEGPLLSFCLYFDSQGDINSLVLPQQAVSKKKPKIRIHDTAAWFQHGDQVAAPYSEHTQELLSQYEEWFFKHDRSEEAQEAVIEQFKQMVTWVIQHLSFEKVLRTDDFVFYADAMDEDYDEWEDTIPAALLKKHFGVTKAA